jgi:hypothetical protein
MLAYLGGEIRVRAATEYRDTCPHELSLVDPAPGQKYANGG